MSAIAVFNMIAVLVIIVGGFVGLLGLALRHERDRERAARSRE